MAVPNRFGRRNVASDARNSRLNTRPGTLNPSMSRGSFLRTAGVVGGAVAAAGLGIGGFGSGVSRAAIVSNDPHGLLAGASTHVDAKWNPDLGYAIDSAVTAVKFHSNVLAGINIDGSAKNLSSTVPGGLVDEPVGIAKEMNGIYYTEYSGELSGYGYSSDIGGYYVYGPIPGPNESTDHPDWSEARTGLKGVCFILRIPKNFNGSMVHFMHGGWPSLDAPFMNSFDEFYLLAQGFAYVTVTCTGYSAASDTNPNNDEFWNDVMNSELGVPGASCPSASKPLVPEPMFSRDAIRVMKNVCNHALQPAERTYLWARSWAGDLSVGLTTGRSYNGIYLGGNYETPYINCPDPSNPAYVPNPDAPMVYDGFINFQIGNGPLWLPDYSSVLDLESAMPISSAPFVYYDAANWSWEDLVLPWLAHKAKNDTSNGDFSAYWPDIKKTIFYYMFENFPHFGYEPVYAVDRNGSGLFAKPAGILTFNTTGDGTEVRWNIKKLFDANPAGLMFWWQSLVGQLLYFEQTSPRQYGTSHQLFNNLHSLVTKGSEMPKCVLDPYWINGGTMWPKFVDGGMYGQSDITDAAPQFNIDAANYAAIQYILANDVLDFDRAQAAPLRMPDDAARLGLYETLLWGMVQYIYYPFSESELMGGCPALDWDGQLLVTMALPNGRQVPQSGYRSHGGYVSAATQAVHNLVQMKLWDPQLAQNFITEASRSPYPLIESRNRGEALKKLEGSALAGLSKKGLMK